MFEALLYLLITGEDRRRDFPLVRLRSVDAIDSPAYSISLRLSFADVVLVSFADESILGLLFGNLFADVGYSSLDLLFDSIHCMGSVSCGNQLVGFLYLGTVLETLGIHVGYELVVLGLGRVYDVDGWCVCISVRHFATFVVIVT